MSRVGSGVRRGFSSILVLLTVGGLSLSGGPARVAAATPGSAGQSIEGAWRAETYALASGAVHEVDGLIFFTATDWTVLFFVVDEGGAARRGSGEGGTYALEGNRLTFRHRYNLSAGEAMEGLPAAELRMQVRDATAEGVEPCTIELTSDRLIIHFPSGNRMEFARSS